MCWKEANFAVISVCWHYISRSQNRTNEPTTLKIWNQYQHFIFQYSNSVPIKYFKLRPRQRVKNKNTNSPPQLAIHNSAILFVGGSNLYLLLCPSDRLSKNKISLNSFHYQENNCVDKINWVPPPVNNIYSWLNDELSSATQKIG